MMRTYNSFLYVTIFCLLIAVLPGCANSTSGVSATPTASVTPSLHQNSIYVESRDGSMYALNAATGKTRWKYQIGSQDISQLQVANGLVYFIRADSTSQTSTMYVLSVENGMLLQHYQVPYFVLEGSSYVPYFVVIHGVIYLTAPGMVFALNSRDGSQLWQYPDPGRGVSMPVVANDAVYVVAPGRVLALNRINGVLLWQYKLGPDSVAPGSIAGSNPAPVVVNNVMYVTGFLTDNLYAMNVSDGSLRWHIHLNNESIRAMYAVSDRIYTSAQSSIYALRADDGSQLWHQTGTDDVSIRFASNGSLYVSTGTQLKALRASDGTLLWQAQGGYSWNVAVADEVVYAGSETSLYALHVSDGAILWQDPIPSLSIAL